MILFLVVLQDMVKLESSTRLQYEKCTDIQPILLTTLVYFKKGAVQCMTIVGLVHTFPSHRTVGCTPSQTIHLQDISDWL